MKKRKIRLASQFAKNGFSVSSLDSRGGHLLLWRPCKLFAELYEGVGFLYAGRRNQFIGGDVRLSLTTGPASDRALSEWRHVSELADPDNTRGFALVDTVDKAKDWEERALRIMPELAVALAKEKGPQVLARSSSARAATKKYLMTIGERNLEIATLRQSASGVQLAEVNRIMQSPGFIWVDREFYELAALAIVLLHDEVEGTEYPFNGMELWQAPELNYRLQMMADYMYARRHQQITGAKKGLTGNGDVATS